jgi:FMN-dependent NADH-azoreductase
VTTVLQVLVSPRRQSVSRLVAQQVIKRIADYHPDGCVVVRDLAADPPPHPGAELYEAILTGASDDDPRLAMSERMIAELESGDLVVVDTPMNNFTVPSTLKAWIDHVVRSRRAFRSSLQGKIGLLRNRPVIVVASHGGFCGDAPAGQPDFLTPYLRTIFGTIGMREIYFLRLEGLSRGEEVVTWALDRANAWIDEHASVLKLS